MENVEIKTEEKPAAVIKEEKAVTSGDRYVEGLQKKKTKDQKKILVEFMKKRNAARAAQKLKPAYSDEDIAKAAK